MTVDHERLAGELLAALDEIDRQNTTYVTESLKVVVDLRHELAAYRANGCPQVETSDNGTSHCQLAESDERIAKALAWDDPTDWLDNSTIGGRNAAVVVKDQLLAKHTAG